MCYERFKTKGDKMNDAETIKIINEQLIHYVVDHLGKDESARRYNRLKTTNPESYADTSNRLGRDVLEFINSL